MDGFTRLSNESKRKKAGSDFALMNRMVRGPDRTCFLAEGGWYNLDRMAQWPPLKSIQLFAERIKQRRACLSNDAADDYDLRIKSIYERSDCSREVMD